MRSQYLRDEIFLRYINIQQKTIFTTTVGMMDIRMNTMAPVQIVSTRFIFYDIESVKTLLCCVYTESSPSWTNLFSTLCRGFKQLMLYQAHEKPGTQWNCKNIVILLLLQLLNMPFLFLHLKSIISIQSDIKELFLQQIGMWGNSLFSCRIGWPVW